MNFAKKLGRIFLKKFDIEITRHSTLQKFQRNSSAAHDIEVLQRLNNTNAHTLSEH